MSSQDEGYGKRKSESSVLKMVFCLFLIDARPSVIPLRLWVRSLSVVFGDEIID